MEMPSEKLTRINKFLSEAGYCSRRHADTLIEQGRITVNGELPEMGTKISEQDEVRVNGELVSASKKANIYLAFHKPVGIVCTTDTSEKYNIIDYINYPSRIFPIGRLDKMSEGLILLTDDGDIVNKILRASNSHEKEYIVTVDRLLTPDFIERMSSGIPILDRITLPCEVEQISKYVFRIVLQQGLNRQIRRMCEYLGYRVKRLKRVRIMHIDLDISKGKYRDLTKEELTELNHLTAEAAKHAVLPEEKHLPPSSDKGISKNSSKSSVKKPFLKGSRQDSDRKRES